MKKNRVHKTAHVLIAAAKVVGVLIAFYYLPPWIKNNPGVLLTAGLLVSESILHAFLPEY